MVIKMDERQRLILKPILVMLASSIVSAVMIVLNKKVLEDGLDVLVLITYRLLVAVLFIAPIAFFFERKSRPKLSFGILICLFVSAILGNSLTQYLFYLGLKFTSATYAAAFFNMTPVITFLLSIVFRQETSNFRSWAGLAKAVGTAVNLGGGMMLTFYKGMVLTKSSMADGLGQHNRLASASMHGSKRSTLGSLALLLGCFLWALWFPLQSRIVRRYRALYTATAIVFFFSFLQTALISFSIQKGLSLWILRSKFQIFTVVYGGIVGSGLSFLASSWCVEKRGPVFAIAFFPVTQVAVAIIDVSLLHEQLHLGSLLGSIVIISGLYILLWGKSKEASDSGSLSKSSETRTINLEASSTAP
ncbi:WAT1-related protein At3g30340 [Dendrobium catenatum]|uniref:WAT1-related protein n=1 Tax=Dendrobium catenatum TaxID=906689 RepID=A0A2I0WPD1_9ASPA|nr:WAT1-related protein At3g30340 [Dendrobium catenatum]PKU77513.1 WAT1-related protein [Dendrobium catenatum]